VLVDDAFMELVGNQDTSWESRRQFYGFAKKVMWEMFVDAVRAEEAEKRGGGKREDADPEQLARVPGKPSMHPLDRLALIETLEKLETIAPEESTVAKWRMMGCEFKEIARFVGLSETTAKNRWAYAQGWLHEQFHKANGPDA
jgi:DNA-directed RNA polymerase specialized sigma24 family protein